MTPAPSSGADYACAILTIDLDAVAANYRLLRGAAAGACAAVVKADGYGLGAARVGARLAREGCRQFFVAQIEEGIALRPAVGAAEIFILNGLTAGAETAFTEHGLKPVLNDPGQIAAWRAHGEHLGAPQDAILHVDTGMSRLGLAPEEVETLAADPDGLKGLNLLYFMTHLVSGESLKNRINQDQKARFEAALARLEPLAPAARASLANSSGVFLGPDYHYDLTRPGCALYGVNPTDRAENPMRHTVTLMGRILQVRSIDAPQTVGYGATHRAGGPARIATVGVGYADGYLRHLSSNGTCYIGSTKVPVVGRVSMDLITLDVTGVPEADARPGGLVEVLGPNVTVDAAAAAADTIGYEILTSLGPRYRRVYIDADPETGG